MGEPINEGMIGLIWGQNSRRGTVHLQRDRGAACGTGIPNPVYAQGNLEQVTCKHCLAKTR